MEAEPAEARRLLPRLYDDPEEAELGAAQGRQGPSDQLARSHFLHPRRRPQPAGTLRGADPRRPRSRPARRSLPRAARRPRHPVGQGSQAAPFEVRREAAEVRSIEICPVVTAPKSATSIPDAKFGDLVVTKFMNSLMKDGKKSAAEGIVYGAFDIVADQDQAGPDRGVPHRARQHPPGRRSAFAPRRWCHLPGAGRSPYRPSAGPGHPLAHRIRPQAWRAHHAASACRASSWMPSTAAARPSRNAKTRTVWLTPTVPSRTTAGNGRQPDGPRIPDQSLP